MVSADLQQRRRPGYAPYLSDLITHRGRDDALLASRSGRVQVRSRAEPLTCEARILPYTPRTISTVNGISCIGQGGLYRGFLYTAYIRY